MSRIAAEFNPTVKRLVLSDEEADCISYIRRSGMEISAAAAIYKAIKFYESFIRITETPDTYFYAERTDGDIFRFERAHYIGQPRIETRVVNHRLPDHTHTSLKTLAKQFNTTQNAIAGCALLLYADICGEAKKGHRIYSYHSKAQMPRAVYSQFML